MYTSEQWRAKAEEARAIGDQYHTLNAKQIMADIADGYERLAMFAERREGTKVGENGNAL